MTSSPDVARAARGFANVRAEVTRVERPSRWAAGRAGAAVLSLLWFLSGCGGDSGAAPRSSAMIDAAESVGGGPAIDGGVSEAGPAASGPDARAAIDGTAAERSDADEASDAAELAPADGPASSGEAGVADVAASADAVSVVDAGAEPASGGGEATAVVASCTVPPVAAPPSIKLTTDVKYYTANGQDQLLDVAAPLGGGPHTLVVLDHGGGWGHGDKLDHRPAIQLLAGQGYVAASVNYRLATASGNHFPAAIQDIRCAIRWLRAQAATYAVDPKRVAVIGTSAGAHLAAMVGTEADVPGLDNPDCPANALPVNVTMAVAYYGIYDLRLPALIPGGEVATFLGTSDQAVATLASPALHVDAGDAPFLLIHGSADNTVPVIFGQLMRSSLQAGGVPATLVELPGVDHGFAVFAPTLLPSTCTTLAYLRAMLAP
jgi:acetyl esterase/lipase